MDRLLEARTLSTEDLAAANERVRDWLESRLDRDAVDLARLYRHNRDTLVQKIRWIYDSYLGENPTYVAARTTGALSRIYNQIELDVQQLADEVGQRAVATMAETLNQHPEVVNQRLGRLAKVQFRDLPISTRTVLGELTTRVTGGGTFFDRITHIDQGLRSTLHGEVRSSLLGGENFNQLRDRFLKAFGVDKLRDPSGPAYGSVKIYKNAARREWNALMFRQGRAADAVAVWMARVDNPVTTPGCLARHGSLIEEINEAPPHHYNCYCTIGIFPRGTDLSSMRMEAEVKLRAQGYTRRQAMLEESGLPPGWAWGRRRLQPALLAARLEEAGEFAAVPWRQLPAVAGGLKVASRPLSEASGMDRPDCALLRPAAAGWEAKTWEGWAPLRAAEAPLVEVAQGWVPDGPGAPEWDEPRLRLPLALIRRWPAMGRVSFPAPPGGGSAYAVALATPPEAEAAALGRAPAVPWEQGQLGPEIWQLLAEQPAISRPHLLLAFPGEQPRCRMVVDLETGQVLLADEPFGRGLAAPYRRAAAFVRESGGLLWAIKPKGLNFWSLPGGHIEAGEDLGTAASREALEEAGLRVRPLRLLGTLYRPWSTTEVIACARIGDPGSPTKAEGEIDAVGLIPFTELASDERAFLARHGAGAEV